MWLQVGSDLGGAFVDVLDKRPAGVVELFERGPAPGPTTNQIRDLGLQGRDVPFVFAQLLIIQPDEERRKALPAMGAGHRSTSPFNWSAIAWYRRGLEECEAFPGCWAS